jgi:hypothetical protein
MLINKDQYNIVKKESIRALVFFSAVILISGCKEEAPVENISAGSRIAGRVAGIESTGKLNKNLQSIAGASVNLMKLNPAGTLEVISTTEAISDTEGKFVIETSLTGSSEVVISAEKDGRTWKAVLTSELKSGITVYSQPLTEESTVEADLYIEAKKLQFNDIQYADISVFVTAEIAALVVNDSYSRNLILQAFEQAAYVQALVVVKGELGGDVNKWKAAVSFFAEAQATFERDLYFSDTRSESEAAVKKYLNSRVFACENAGLQAGLYYNTISIAQKVFLNVNNYLPQELKFFLNKRNAYIKSLVLRHAVQKEFSQLGAPGTIISAGNILNTKILAAGSEEEINNGFDEYRLVIINQLKSAEGLNAMLITDAAGAIAELSDNFWITVTPGISLDEIANSYVAFYGQVKGVLNDLILLAGKTKGQRVLSILFFTSCNYKV